MIFKVPNCKEEIGDPLNMYSVNHDISSNQPFFKKVQKEEKTLVSRGKDCELYLESSELVGGQIMR